MKVELNTVEIEALNVAINSHMKFCEHSLNVNRGALGAIEAERVESELAGLKNAKVQLAAALNHDR